MSRRSGTPRAQMSAVGAQREIEAWVGQVNAHLGGFFEAQHARCMAVSPRAPELVDAVRELTMRGGKRLRPAALYAGFRAVSPGGDAAQTSDACSALELLQTYLLIQDDWMDDDSERRGGPSVHALLARAHGDEKLGASLAILAADLAAGFAFELMTRAPFPTARVREGLAAFYAMHTEVVCGQQLDLLEHPDFSLTHHLKTGSYTVRGPLKLGALLGDASQAQLDALDAFGAPLGVAFQLRDDLLGTFGDPARTGKPAGHDLREGKNTALIAEARATLPKPDLQFLESVLDDAMPTSASITKATDLLIRSGVKARVESRLATLITEARTALTTSPLSPEGIALLTLLLDRIAKRDH
jgi:geranylgeranyl diphosphate synthase, type I